MTDPIVEGATCACLDVQYNPKQNEDGTARDRWTCKLCGSEFVQIAHLENTMEQVELLLEENHLQNTYINSLESEMEDLDDMLDYYREND